MDLMPPPPHSDPFEHLRGLLWNRRGFCDSLQKLHDNDTAAIIMNPYSHLKKALKEGFCDPSSLLSQDVSSRRGTTNGRSLGVSKVSSPGESSELGDVGEDEEEGSFVVVTHPGGGRLERISRALETVLFAALILYLTLRALLQLKLGFEVELKPQAPGSCMFQIS